MKTQNTSFNSIRIGIYNNVEDLIFTEEYSPANSVISNDGKEILISAAESDTAFINSPRKTGKKYIEIEYTNDSTQYLGLSNEALNPPLTMLDTEAVYVFGNGNARIKDSSGTTSYNSFVTYSGGSFYGSPNVVGFAVDFDNSSIYWVVNGESSNSLDFSSITVSPEGFVPTINKASLTLDCGAYIRSSEEAQHKPVGYDYW